MTKRIGRFEIAEEIGQGLAGTIFKGTDPTTGRTVMVETITLEAMKDAAAREDALKAARDAGVLSHPNIALILDVGADDEVAFVVREFIEGRSLADHISEGAPFQPAALLPGLEQIADALDYAHRRGVIHGNFEPANVTISRLGQVKITGFGYARIASKAAHSAHALEGSPEYMAPEKVRGEAIGPRSDIYSFGAIVYELLTGQAPFKSDSVITTIFKSVNEQAPPPSTLSPDLPAGLDAIVMRTLAKSPTDRFENCRQFVDAARAALRPDETPTAATAEPATRFCDQCGAVMRPNATSCHRCEAAAREAAAAKPQGRASETQPVAIPVVPQEVRRIPAVVLPTEAVPVPVVEAGSTDATLYNPPPPEPVRAPEPVREPEPPTLFTAEPDKAPVEFEEVPTPLPEPAYEPAVVAAVHSSGSHVRVAGPAPLSGYAESLGEDLPAPGEVIDAEPKRPSVIVAMLPWIILMLILVGFASFGFWIAPRILKPTPPPPQQTSSVVAQSAPDHRFV